MRPQSLEIPKFSWQSWTWSVALPKVLRKPRGCRFAAFRLGRRGSWVAWCGSAGTVAGWRHGLEMAEVVPGGSLPVSGCWVADASADHVLMLMNSVFLFYKLVSRSAKGPSQALFFSFERQVELLFIGWHELAEHDSLGTMTHLKPS